MREAVVYMLLGMLDFWFHTLRRTSLAMYGSGYTPTLSGGHPP